MKRRAFFVILITAVTMLIVFSPYMFLIILCSSLDNLDPILHVGYIFFILAGVVQPLLFLYQVGKLPSIKCQ